MVTSTEPRVTLVVSTTIVPAHWPKLPRTRLTKCRIEKLRSEWPASMRQAFGSTGTAGAPAGAAVAGPACCAATRVAVAKDAVTSNAVRTDVRMRAPGILRHASAPRMRGIDDGVRERSRPRTPFSRRRITASVQLHLRRCCRAVVDAVEQELEG